MSLSIKKIFTQKIYARAFLLVLLTAQTVLMPQAVFAENIIKVIQIESGSKAVNRALVSGLRLGLEYALEGTWQIEGHTLVIETWAPQATTNEELAVELASLGSNLFVASASSGFTNSLIPLIEQQNKTLITHAAPNDLSASKGNTNHVFRVWPGIKDQIASTLSHGKNISEQVTVWVSKNDFYSGVVNEVKSEMNIEADVIEIIYSETLPGITRSESNEVSLVVVPTALLESAEIPPKTKVLSYAKDLNAFAYFSSLDGLLTSIYHYRFDQIYSDAGQWLLETKLQRHQEVPDSLVAMGFTSGLAIKAGLQKWILDGKEYSLNKAFKGLEIESLTGLSYKIGESFRFYAGEIKASDKFSGNLPWGQITSSKQINSHND